MTKKHPYFFVLKELYIQPCEMSQSCLVKGETIVIKLKALYPDKDLKTTDFQTYPYEFGGFIMSQSASYMKKKIVDDSKYQ